MTTPSIHCEARLKGIAKRHDRGGDWAQITLQVQPQDLPDELWQAPLGSIFMVAFARVGDDGVAVKQEVAKPKAKVHFRNLPRCQQAGILCNDATFQRWAASLVVDVDVSEEGARQFVLHQCGIGSRRELDGSGGPALKWDELLDSFEADTGRTTEARG